MKLLRYPIACQCCGAPARHKIASRWTDGHTSELKTYGLVCSECVSDSLAEARKRRQECRTAPDEQIDVPEIFDLAPGKPSKLSANQPNI
jgi:hypothetical protein